MGWDQNVHVTNLHKIATTIILEAIHVKWDHEHHQRNLTVNMDIGKEIDTIMHDPNVSRICDSLDVHMAKNGTTHFTPHAVYRCAWA